MFIDHLLCVKVFGFITDFLLKDLWFPDFLLIWLLPMFSAKGQFSSTFPVLAALQFSNADQQFWIPTISYEVC